MLFSLPVITYKLPFKIAKWTKAIWKFSLEDSKIRGFLPHLRGWFNF